MQYIEQKSIHLDHMTQTVPKSVINWLYFSAFMVLCMAVIGAITRLTESGLSMVEWKPLIGAIPPLSDTEWNRVFDLYKQTPEFIHKNYWMGMDDFKYIFFWEWFHRFWGRLIGLVYALPLIYFWIKNMIPSGYKPRLLLALFLGGMQAVMGWYMVVSGLVDRPSVSHYRLAAHLSLAMIIFVYLLWMAFDLSARLKPIPVQPVAPSLRLWGYASLILIALTIIWGAFTAGLDAGMIYNTWPMMDRHWIPPEVTGLASLHHDAGAVQFVHRWIAIITAGVVLIFAWKAQNGFLAASILLQVVLGLSALLSQLYIPVAAAHQAGAFVVLALLFHQLFVIRSSSRVA